MSIDTTMSNDLEACHLLRCSLNELDSLKQTIRREMLNTYVNYRPLLGQDINEVDTDAPLCEAIWDATADRNVFFGAMLSGARWLHKVPDEFFERLAVVKKRIVDEENHVALNSKPARFFSPLISDISRSKLADESMLSTSPSVSMCAHAEGPLKQGSEARQDNVGSGVDAMYQAAYADTFVRMSHWLAGRDCCTKAPSSYSALPLSIDIENNWTSENFMHETDYNNSSLPFTPTNSPSAADSDTLSIQDDASDEASDDVMSEARDPFCDTPYNTHSSNRQPTAEQSVGMTLSPDSSVARSPFARSLSPSPLAVRPTLSARIRAVSEAIGRMETRLANLEESMNRIYEMNARHCELLEKLILKVEGMAEALEGQSRELDQDLPLTST